MKNMKLATKISIIVTAILTVGLIALWVLTDTKVSSLMREQVLQEMNDAVSTRSEIVEQYVQSAESYLIGFGQSLELKEALRQPNNTSVVEKAQSYTEGYALVNPNMENVYLADYNSTVLTSYVKGPIGKTLREGDALKQLRDEVFDSDEIWNTGIMASLSTGLQVVSMYYPVYDGSKPIGYVGGAIYVEDLRNTLNALQESEDGKTDYMLLDAAKNTYIFCADDTKIGTTIEEENVLKVMENASANQEQAGYCEYAENGKKMLAVYEYMPDRDWVFVIMTDCDVAFASVNQMSVMLAVICIVVLLIIAAGVWVASMLIAKNIVKVSRIIGELGTLDLTLRHKLDAYASRKDEIGMIAKATLYLTETVGDAVKTLKEKNAELAATSKTLLNGAEVTKGSVDNV